MIFRQFYLEALGHASYFIGSDQTGEALVLDPRRDVDPYLEEARAGGMQIRYILDTHQHNDYVSGILELQSRTQAELLSGENAKLQYKTRSLADGSRLEMGEIVFEALHTPGHTPEHISMLVTDRSRGEEPALLLSGGALLVGDLGRPDLLGGSDQTLRLAESLYRTISEKILKLPDFVEVYPTHVSGSLCGGNIGRRLSTTMGYERRLNHALANLGSLESFVKRAADPSSLPAVPAYFQRMRPINQQGPPILGALPEPPALSASAFETWQKKGAVVLDCRSSEAFGIHIPGALNVGLNSLFVTWAGSILPAGVPIVLVLESERDLWEVCWYLLRIGFDLPKGWLSGGMRTWRVAAKPLEILPQWTVKELQEAINRKENVLVLDVRQPNEWSAGHIRNGLHIPGADIHKRFSEVPKDRTVAVICGSGYRSSAVASLLKTKGYKNLVNVLGGMHGWKHAGFETMREEERVKAKS